MYNGDSKRFFCLGRQPSGPSEATTKMLSKQSDEHYRRLPLGEKLRLALEMCRRHEPCLLVGTPDHVRRKFELIRHENDLRNANMLAAFARTEL